jgi:hypothetical protein
MKASASASSPDVEVPIDDALIAAGPLDVPPEFLDWDAPLHGRISDVFGPRDDGSVHDAIDVAAGVGSEVKAPADMRVVYVGYRTKAGRFILADTVDGAYELTFAHLSHVDVVDGQRVGRGTTLGLTGITGSVTGPHLHFRIETIDDDGGRTAIDPLSVIPAERIQNGADVTDAAAAPAQGTRDGDVDDAIDHAIDHGVDDPRGDAEDDLGVARGGVDDDLGVEGGALPVDDDLGVEGSKPTVDDDVGVEQ